MARALPVFDKFDINGDSKTSLGPRWTKYVQKLENLFVAMNVDSNKRKEHFCCTMPEMRCLRYILH